MLVFCLMSDLDVLICCMVESITYNRAGLIRAGYSVRIHKVTDLTDAYIERYLIENNIKFKTFFSSPYEGQEDTEYYAEDFFSYKIDTWLMNVSRSFYLYNELTSAIFLSRLRLSKNAFEKIRNIYLKCSLDLEMGDFSGRDYETLAKAILSSYKNYGIDIDSIKDFQKLIARDAAGEVLKIKFLEEAQAAEFAMNYGVEFK